MHKAPVDYEWFKQRKAELGLKDAQIAEAAGRERSVINKILNGAGSFAHDRADQLADLFGTTRLQMLHRIGVLRADDLPANTAALQSSQVTLADIAVEHGFTFLEELDLALGMGATFLSGNADVVGLVPFKLDWLRGVHEGAMSHLKVVRGEGDSMEPTIHGGDIVLIDTATRRIDRQDGLWALAYGDLGMIRRVRVRPDGTWVLMAEKDTVRDETVGDGEVAVIGRVIWSARQY